MTQLSSSDIFEPDPTSAPGPDGLDARWAQKHGANEESGAPVLFSRTISAAERHVTDPGDDIIEVGGKILSTLDIHDPDSN